MPAPKLRKVAARQRADRGVIATYLLELSERRGRVAERIRLTRPRRRDGKQRPRAADPVGVTT